MPGCLRSSLGRLQRLLCWSITPTDSDPHQPSPTSSQTNIKADASQPLPSAARLHNNPHAQARHTSPSPEQDNKPGQTDTEAPSEPPTIPPVSPEPMSADAPDMASGSISMVTKLKGDPGILAVPELPPPPAYSYSSGHMASSHLTSGPSSERTRSDQLLSSAKVVLSCLGYAFKVANVPGSALFEGCVKIINAYETNISNKEAVDILRSRCEHIIQFVASSLPEIGEEHVLSDGMIQSLRSFGSRLADIEARMENLHHNSLWALLNAEANAQSVQRIIDDFGQALFTLAFEMTFSSRLALDRGKRTVDRYLKNNVIEKLPHADAAYNDVPETGKVPDCCLAGTADGLLEEILSWSQTSNKSDSRIFVLSGHAGCGKSTIARTIASFAAKGGDRRLGASFFFSRESKNSQSTSRRLFPTIAYQLCLLDQKLADAIGGALCNPIISGAVSKDLKTQLQSLILDPLRDVLQEEEPMLIVVDALDECDNSTDLQNSVLDTLIELVQQQPNFKVFLTIRPRGGLEQRSNLLHLREIRLGDITVRPYLNHHLVNHVPDHMDWKATPAEIDALDETADNVFVVASTIVRYLCDERKSVNLGARMKAVLERISGPLREGVYDRLHFFYKAILRNTGLDEKSEIELFKAVVGAISFVTHPVPVKVISRLTGKRTSEVNNVVEKFLSVILVDEKVDEDKGSLRIYHISFTEYLTSEECTHQIDPTSTHQLLLEGCLSILDEDLGKSGDCQSPELNYAMLSWASHMEDGEGCITVLKKFLGRDLWARVRKRLGPVRGEFKLGALKTLRDGWFYINEKANENSDFKLVLEEIVKAEEALGEPLHEEIAKAEKTLGVSIDYIDVPSSYYILCPTYEE